MKFEHDNSSDRAGWFLQQDRPCDYHLRQQIIQEAIDDAALGRFDQIIEIPLPDE